MGVYHTVNRKKHKKGFTTGACVAAAAKASVMMLYNRNKIFKVTIDTPSGLNLTLPISDISLFEQSAECAVTKDGGDDPDVTTGLKIFAKVRINSNNNISINAGEGVGIVTLPGLKIPVGKPAINPVPMEMIKKEVREVLPDGMGADIVVRIPGGEEIAKKTYNPKLGIRGGISILGTKGIVEPMSQEAWKEALSLEIDVAAAKGIKELYFTFGNHGRDFVKDEFGIGDEYIITMSNFVGFMLDKALENNIKKVVVVGHMGKLIKVSAGIFNTHSSVADARMEILVAYAALEGAPKDLTHRIYECKTTDAAADIIDRYGITKVYEKIAENTVRRCSQHVFNKIEISAVLFKEDKDKGTVLLSQK
ncbi:cobalt-precorrin-5B (C(1))-methyltransferase CbiD [Herbivorax sp. ANBcel31]|uniref:cobalt-precorrin-5B (C(1))-methyltransferase CbiD n=1 Tax=Herbivorax sp. ANBcel31 TaxID=3069754 RepID=UPI0027B53728|nr:cobalt-precorrin-5B (C(1))-methyltransferase CbiD [Herbivorax sp. ANBcel31]MDQ2086943.1 cobalt-precorrin-5B (C(1))-methyltransferase CbiD [Herbivorax sp. ANBcel31]